MLKRSVAAALSIIPPSLRDGPEPGAPASGVLGIADYPEIARPARGIRTNRPIGAV